MIFKIVLNVVWKHENLDSIVAYQACVAAFYEIYQHSCSFLLLLVVFFSLCSFIDHGKKDKRMKKKNEEKLSYFLVSKCKAYSFVFLIKFLVILLIINKKKAQTFCHRNAHRIYIKKGGNKSSTKFNRLSKSHKWLK